MTISQTGLNLIKRFEGLRLTAYKDATGTLTIGYGHTGKDVREGQTITEEQAESLLRQDLKSSEYCVEQAAQAHINQNQFDALVSFTFNVGT